MFKWTCLLMALILLPRHKLFGYLCCASLMPAAFITSLIHRHSRDQYGKLKDYETVRFGYRNSKHGD